MLGRGLRLEYRYRIVTDECSKCGRTIEYAKRGRGKIWALYCAVCKVKMNHIYIQKERVIRH